MQAESPWNDEDGVSCLCVTRGRVPLLQRAVACFLAQTWPARELLLVHDADDAETVAYVAGIDHPQIRGLCVPTTPKLSLGALRNLSVQAARGRYIANWDDDDWHGPERLAAQIGALRSAGKPACVLLRWLMYDAVEDACFVSARRPWEGSLVAERSVMPQYPSLARGEDTPLVGQMAAAGQLAGLDRPSLYVYLHHGRNTWDREHWRTNIARHAQRLPAAQAEAVRRLMAPAAS